MGGGRGRRSPSKASKSPSPAKSSYKHKGSSRSAKKSRKGSGRKGEDDDEDSDRRRHSSPPRSSAVKPTTPWERKLRELKARARGREQGQIHVCMAGRPGPTKAEGIDIAKEAFSSASLVRGWSWPTSGAGAYMDITRRQAWEKARPGWIRLPDLGLHFTVTPAKPQQRDPAPLRVLLEWEMSADMGEGAWPAQHADEHVDDYVDRCSARLASYLTN